MELEYRAQATRRGRTAATITSVFCAGAMDAKRSGDWETHDRLIAESAADVRDTDVIMLAQFSMASAAPSIQAKTDTPVLTSPEAAIKAMRRRVQPDR